MTAINKAKELLERLNRASIGVFHRESRILRESFEAPYTVESEEEFRTVLCDFHAHYTKHRYGVDNRQLYRDNPEGWATYCRVALSEIEWLLGGYKEFREAVKNATTGREGGMIRLIDRLTGLWRQIVIKTYIKDNFKEALTDPAIGVAFLEEYFRTFGPVMFPGERLPHPAMLMFEIERVIENHLLATQGLKKELK